MGDVIPFGDRPLTPQRAMERIKTLWQEGQVEIQPHAGQQMRARRLEITDVEHIIRYGRVVEHSRPRPGGPWRYKVEGSAVDGGWAACVVELVGRLLIITVIGKRTKRGGR